MFPIVTADNLTFLPNDACKENMVSPRLSSSENIVCSYQLSTNDRSVERYNFNGR